MREKKKSMAFHLIRRHMLGIVGIAILLGWVIMAILAPYLTPYGATQQDFQSRLQPPSAAHLLGTDQLGRDLLTRILYGGRISIPMAIIIVIFGAFVGVAIGSVAGRIHR